MDNVRKSKKTKGSMEQILQEVLIGNNSQNRYLIFNRLAAASAPILHTFHARSLSDVTYAFGLAEVIIPIKGGRTFFDILADATIAIPNLQHFNAQDLSNMLWAYANVGVLNSMLLKEVEDTIISMNNLDSSKSQELVSILWSYATLKEQHPKLFKKVENHIVGLDNLNKFWPQELCNIVWAYATVEEKHSELFQKVACHIVIVEKPWSYFKPQELSNILLSCLRK